MSRSNPFTPSFGGMPDHFFGREGLLERVRSSLDGFGDTPDRVLFITGPRGCGKTALLERLSRMACSEGWLCVDVHSTEAVRDIMQSLALLGEAQAKLTPRVSVLGMDISLGEASTSTAHAPQEGLTQALLARCDALLRHKGVFITIDEIQEISEHDMEEVCAAVQMARRKGYPVALMLAGLPGSKEKVAGYRGCTFMQRAQDERIGALFIDETTAAFRELFNLVPRIEADDEAIWAAASYSQGYPYLIQLVGYHLVRYLDESYPIGDAHLQPAHVEVVEEEVYGQYRSNVLVPSTRSLGAEARAYLQAMARLLDGEGLAPTGQVARELGKTPSQLSTCRQGLIDRRLVRAAGYGKVRFGLPHLSRFALEQQPVQSDVSPREWPTR